MKTFATFVFVVLGALTGLAHAKNFRERPLSMEKNEFPIGMYTTTKGKKGKTPPPVILSRSEGSITFVVDEDLPAPKKLFEMDTAEAITKQIISKEQIPWNLQHVVKTSFEWERVKYLGEDNFYRCMVEAYADHRPVALSPDVVWLLISQGFARYVNANPEEMRDKLVEHEGKMDLVVESGIDFTAMLDSASNAPQPSDSDWENLLNQFSTGIAKNTKDGVAEWVTADFTTTGVTERVASQITLMETVKSYFTYREMSFGCGTPSVTLTGTPDDWEKVLQKARGLSKYGLTTWSGELETVLQEFVKASRGEPDRRFWQGMMRKRRARLLLKGGMCGPGVSTLLDGWFLKFFPNKQGKTEKAVAWDRTMPSEMVRVGFKHVRLTDDGADVMDIVPIELWAGIVGVSVNSETHALIPRIGWLARVADEEAESLSRLKEQDEHGRLYFSLWKKESRLPKILSKMEHIRSLSIDFYKNIPVTIPAWLDGLTIDKLTIEGYLTADEEADLRRRFPKAIIKNNSNRDE